MQRLRWSRVVLTWRRKTLPSPSFWRRAGAFGGQFLHHSQQPSGSQAWVDYLQHERGRALHQHGGFPATDRSPFWQNSDGSKYEPATKWFEQDGKTFTVPKYGGGRGDADLEGEVATPAVLIEHAATVAPEPEPAAPSPMEALSVVPEPESAAVRCEREQVDAWIRNRLIAYPLASCLRCRKPFVAGAAWEEVSNGGARARFHRACHAEWRAEREAAARQALGLEG